MTLKAAAIGIIFKEHTPHVLLIKRKDIPIWVLPGGGIDDQETPEEAVIREIKEETGLQVSIERKCAEYFPENSLGSLTNVFICKIISGELSLSDETTDIGFYPIDHYPQPFFHVHATWINDALTHQTLLRAPLVGVTYSALIKYVFKHPIYMLQYLAIRLKKFFK